MKRVYCIKTKQEITNVVIAPNDSYIYIIKHEQNAPQQHSSKFENGEPIASLMGFYVYLSKHKDDINIKIYGDNYVVDNVVRNMSNDALFAFYLNQKRDATFWEKNMICIFFFIALAMLVWALIIQFNAYLKYEIRILEQDKILLAKTPEEIQQIENNIQKYKNKIVKIK